jgi:hypothetical protein
MALVQKNELLRTLRTVTHFDVGGSPYLMVQFPPSGGVPNFFRSSQAGFIQSTNLGAGQRAYVSLSHLKEGLQVLKDDQVSLSLSSSGGVTLSSTDHVYESELRIHTVHKDQAGIKQHDIGDVNLRLDPSIFTGFDSRPFSCAAPPSLFDGRIMLPTIAGISIWTGPDELKQVHLQPRESLLKFISQSVDEVCLSEKGYWGGASGGLVSFIGGHTTGPQLYSTYSLAGVELARLPRARLLTSLQAASSLCSDTDKVELCPIHGVTTRDPMGNQARFSIGQHTGWTKFRMLAKTAKLIVDTLTQTAGEEAVLKSVPGHTQNTFRLECGSWETNFKTF